MKIATLTGALTLIGTIIGGVFFVETRYASAADMKVLRDDLDYKIMSDESYQIRQRVWELEDRSRDVRLSADDKIIIQRDIQDLNERKLELDRRLDAIIDQRHAR